MQGTVEKLGVAELQLFSKQQLISRLLATQLEADAAATWARMVTEECQLLSQQLELLEGEKQPHNSSENKTCKLENTEQLRPLQKATTIDKRASITDHTLGTTEQCGVSRTVSDLQEAESERNLYKQQSQNLQEQLDRLKLKLDTALTVMSPSVDTDSDKALASPRDENSNNDVHTISTLSLRLPPVDQVSSPQYANTTSASGPGMSAAFKASYYRTVEKLRLRVSKLEDRLAQARAELQAEKRQKAKLELELKEVEELADAREKSTIELNSKVLKLEELIVDKAAKVSTLRRQLRQYKEATEIQENVDHFVNREKEQTNVRNNINCSAVSADELSCEESDSSKTDRLRARTIEVLTKRRRQLDSSVGGEAKSIDLGRKQPLDKMFSALRVALSRSQHEEAMTPPHSFPLNSTTPSTCGASAGSSVTSHCCPDTVLLASAVSSLGDDCDAPLTRLCSHEPMKRARA